VTSFGFGGIGFQKYYNRQSPNLPRPIDPARSGLHSGLRWFPFGRRFSPTGTAELCISSPGVLTPGWFTKIGVKKSKSPDSPGKVIGRRRGRIGVFRPRMRKRFEIGDGGADHWAGRKQLETDRFQRWRQRTTPSSRVRRRYQRHAYSPNGVWETVLTHPFLPVAGIDAIRPRQCLRNEIDAAPGRRPVTMLMSSRIQHDRLRTSPLHQEYMSGAPRSFSRNKSRRCR